MTRTAPKASRPYFTLVERTNAWSIWTIQFGGFDREDVAAELQDMVDHGVAKSNLKILKTANASADTINEEVTKLNIRTCDPATRAAAISAQVERIVEGAKEVTPELASRIILAFNGDGDAWTVYDSEFWRQPGFWAVRSIRNSPVYGRVLLSSWR